MLPLNLFLYNVVVKLFSKVLPDKPYLSILYCLRFKRRLNWDNPKTYNEKIQSLKLCYRDITLSRDVDKYQVRSKIKDVVGEEYLIPILGVYTSYEQIDFANMPNQFVVKCTHGTHCSVICKNKDIINHDVMKTKLKKWMRHNYFYDAREWPYKHVKPRIMIEQYISDSNGELIDYKFMCFNGKVKLILVHQDISNAKRKHTLDIYTPDWELTNIEWGVPRSGKAIRRPKNLETCIEISERLSKGKPHVRVDLYIVDEKIYFGELTYYTAAGFKPFKNMDDDVMIGSWISLERIRFHNE